MACLPKSTVLSKLNLFISVLALAMYIVGGVISQWIKAKFDIPTVPATSVDVHMGLVESCSEATVMGTVVSDGCSRDGGSYISKTHTGFYNSFNDFIFIKKTYESN